MTRILVLCAGLLVLTGCGGEVGLAVLAASTATFIHTDKTPVDYAVGHYRDEDCSILYAAYEEQYCKPLQTVEVDPIAEFARTHHCYRTLGGVSCYDQPELSASTQTRVNFANTPAPSHSVAQNTARQPDAGL